MPICPRAASASDLPIVSTSAAPHTRLPAQHTGTRMARTRTHHGQKTCQCRVAKLYDAAVIEL